MGWSPAPGEKEAGSLQHPGRKPRAIRTEGRESILRLDALGREELPRGLPVLSPSPPDGGSHSQTISLSPLPYLKPALVKQISVCRLQPLGTKQRWGNHK